MRRAIVAIGCSMVVTTLLFAAVHMGWRTLRQQWACDDGYTVTTLVQECRSPHQMASQALAELLGLSCDKPINLYAFDVRRAERGLAAFPALREAHLSLQPPGVVRVTYALREPLLLLADYENVAVDREGRLFPLDPIYAPQRIPELYMGLGPFGGEGGATWGVPLRGPSWELALRVVDQCEAMLPAGCRLQRIDVQKAFAQSADRELVVALDNSLLRMRRIGFEKTLTAWCELKKAGALEGKQMVDMRLAHIALVR